MRIASGTKLTCDLGSSGSLLRSAFSINSRWCIHFDGNDADYNWAVQRLFELNLDNAPAIVAAAGIAWDGIGAIKKICF